MTKPNGWTGEKCFACGKTLANPSMVDTRDGQHVLVGHECYRRIVSAGESGYQPPKGGPRLYQEESSK